MKNNINYFSRPTDKIFNEIKEKAIKIWQSYDDTYGYASSKINRIKDLKNVRDNVMFIVGMFDLQNQAKLKSLISDEAREAIYQRLKAGGYLEKLNMFRKERS